MAQNLPALADLDIGMASETDILANQIATELDLGLKPSLPAVVGDGPVGIPADAAAALARSKEKAAILSNQLQTNINVGNKQADAMANAILTSVEADQTIALVSNTADLKEENRTIEIFEALGGHEAQVDRAKDAREFEIQLEALSEKKADILDDKHTGIGIIDDVINGFRVIRTEVALDSTVEQNAINQQAIVAATATTESAARTNALVKKTVNEGTIAANQRKIAAAGQVEMSKVILAQNASAAETLQAMLSVSNQEMSNIMRGYELAGSVESRQIQRERHQLALRQFEQSTVMNEVAIRRARIGEQREILQLQVDEGTADAKVRSQLLALDAAEVLLDQQMLNLSEAETTSDDRIASVKLARASAETALDAANLAFEQAQDDAENPEVQAAAKAQRDLAILNFERAEFEFNELEDQTGLRLASREGALAAQTLNNEILAINARAAALLEEGRTDEALAALDEARGKRADTVTVKASNAENVRQYQSFIFGEHAVEDPAVINSQLDSGNTLYALMRQLGSARGPNGEFILGITPAKANANLTLMEQHGVISNDITGVRILREVRSTLQKQYEDNPQSVPTDETAAAIQFNAAAEKYRGDKGSEIVFGDATNPFQPPTIPQLTTMSSTLAAQPLFSKVLTPEGNVDTNPDSIIAKGLVAIQAGTLSQEQVVEGIVAMGNVIAINTNVNHHGMATIGLPYITEVNMRVMRPRGFTASVLDSIQSSPALSSGVPAVAGFITGLGVLTAPVSGGGSIPVAAVLSAGVTATAALALQESSDFTTLNIADPVAVRQHLIAILSSSTLGGIDTEDTLDAAAGGE